VGGGLKFSQELHSCLDRGLKLHAILRLRKGVKEPEEIFKGGKPFKGRRASITALRGNCSQNLTTRYEQTKVTRGEGGVQDYLQVKESQSNLALVAQGWGGRQ